MCRVNNTALQRAVDNTTDQLTHCSLTLQGNITHVFRLELGLVVGWSVVGVEWLARLVWSHYKETNFPLDRHCSSSRLSEKEKSQTLHLSCFVFGCCFSNLNI